MDWIWLYGLGRHKVIGFGKEYAELYGLGGKFDEAEEEQNKVSRFHSEIDDLENGNVFVESWCSID